MNFTDYKLNKIYVDEFGRKSGILALNKPADITSHDLVDRVRKKLNTKRVGHCGALDPFATGVMITLVGKATKLSNELTFLNKTYKFEVLLGLSSDTKDIEGKILKIQDTKNISNKNITNIVKSFKGKYLQEVPIYSSVKIKGIRLRELARNSKSFNTFIKNNKKYAKFKIIENTSVYKKLKRQKRLDSKNSTTIKIPERKVNISNIRVSKINTIKSNELNIKLNIKKILCFKKIQIEATVSKGTYIRQMAEDIGHRIDKLPAILYSLERTQIGDINKSDSIKIQNL